ncbi:glutamate receptor ionotropic, NMDA 3A-like [Penaeus vannamei]|uniref:glutamate receptor ionotropic, NMDA 3A-like n=1 Tax=Penaeus vannamei TaxID=6689 RepID=UPI00387F9679
MEVPLLAFLVPFSLELWMAILVSLNITAFSVAIYEWLSPFGLNPWGRQRSKNFSYGSALWVIWGLLFSHLVAFKAPKSWPNKVLINVWGAFSVIFVASYTANIAALFAGLFQTRYLHDQSLIKVSRVILIQVFSYHRTNKRLRDTKNSYLHNGLKLCICIKRIQYSIKFKNNQTLMWISTNKEI